MIEITGTETDFGNGLCAAHLCTSEDGKTLPFRVADRLIPDCWNLYRPPLEERLCGFQERGDRKPDG